MNNVRNLVEEIVLNEPEGTRRYQYLKKLMRLTQFMEELSGASNDLEYLCCHGSDSLYAGFQHIYLPANPNFAKSFVENAKKWNG